MHVPGALGQRAAGLPHHPERRPSDRDRVPRSRPADLSAADTRVR